MREALLVIDVQRALFEPSPRSDEADEVIDRINALTARARGVGTPVVFIQHETPRGSLAFEFPVTLVADAHTTHDAAHATGAAMRVHENAVLPSLDSFGPPIEAKTTTEVLGLRPTVG